MAAVSILLVVQIWLRLFIVGISFVVERICDAVEKRFLYFLYPLGDVVDAVVVLDIQIFGAFEGAISLGQFLEDVVIRLVNDQFARTETSRGEMQELELRRS